VRERLGTANAVICLRQHYSALVCVLLVGSLGGHPTGVVEGDFVVEVNGTRTAPYEFDSVVLMIQQSTRWV
jgi:hypothetical protein